MSIQSFNKKADAQKAFAAPDALSLAHKAPRMVTRTVQGQRVAKRTWTWSKEVWEVETPDASETN